MGKASRKRKFSDGKSDAGAGGSVAGDTITVSEPSPKKRRSQRILNLKAASQLDGTGNAAIVGSTSRTNPSADEMATEKSVQGSRRGWNQGVSSTLRTSFSSFSSFSSSVRTAPPQASLSAAPENPQPTKSRAQRRKGAGKGDGNASHQDSGQVTGDDSRGVTSTASSISNGPGSGTRLVFKKHGREWILPPPAASENNKLGATVWRNRFCIWCGAFTALNPTCTYSDADRNLMVEAYAHWADSSPSWSRKQRKAAKAVALQTGKQASLPQLIKAARDASGTGIEGDPTANGSATLPSRDMEEETSEANPSSARMSPASSTEEDGLNCTQRYFPGISAEAIFCALCASSGHRQDSCPNMICRFCDTREHPSYACPTRRRCSKCKQLGHVAADCEEKLALAPGEGTECAFCQAQDHTEAGCVEFRRSYFPDENNIRKIKNMPIYCYCCGAKGHYGTQCGLSPQASRPVLHETWSSANCQRYVDQDSGEVGIAWDVAAGALLNEAAHERPDFGKGIARRTHIIFEDDDGDDDDEPFIRPPVQRPPPPAKIKVDRRNGGAPTLGVNGHQGKHQRKGARQTNAPVNPPLPPGPPPPLAASAHGLPNRPPAPAPQSRGKKKKKQKPHENNQQSRQNPSHAQGQNAAARRRELRSREKAGKRANASEL